MGLFEMGAYTLSSGQMSNFKIDCDALSDKDIQTCAMLIADIVPPFGAIEGVPSGGLRLAAAMEKYAGESDALLIVDDVLTTGYSMEEQRSGREACGAVIFSRAADWPSWIRPLFVMTPPVRR